MMFFAKFECADGAYVDVLGVRYDVVSVRRVRNRSGVNVGYVAFPSLQDALVLWGVMPVACKIPAGNENQV